MVEEIYLGICLGLVPIGAAFGVVINHLAVKLVISRRRYLFGINIINLIVAGCMQIGEVPCLFTFRALQGVIAGIYLNFAPTYIGELVPKDKCTSRYVTYAHLFIVFGVMTSFIVGMALNAVFGFEMLPMKESVAEMAKYSWQSEVNWRVTFGVAAIPCLVQTILILLGFIPESPRSLLQQNRREEAMKVFLEFYPEEKAEELLKDRELSIFEEVNKHEKIHIQWTKKGFYLGFQVAVFQALAGIPSYVTQTGHVIMKTLK